VSHGDLRRHAVFAALGLAAAALAPAGPPALAALAYYRPAVSGGEWWRLATGHLVHAGAAHAALNLAGLVLVWAALGRALGASAWVAAAAAAGLASTGALFVFHPEVRAMAGLSAVLHGLMAAGAVADSMRGRRLARAFAVLLAAKLAWEQAFGSTSALAGPVAVEAHLYGAIAGAAVGALAAARVRRVPAH
jgi:rhomboid family GlyGly-CTERM serine protease